VRGLGTKAKKLNRLIEVLKEEDTCKDPANGAPAQAGPGPAVLGTPAAGPAQPQVGRKRAATASQAGSCKRPARKPQKKAISTPLCTEGDDDQSSSDVDVSLAVRTRKKRQTRKKVVVTPPSSSESTDGDDEESSSSDMEESDDEESSSSDVEESLATRKKRMSDMAEDYTFDDMTPGSFAVTVAGGEENDKCWFTVLLPGGGKSVPLHFVEVVAQHPNKKEITWQFWLPAKQQRVFNNVEDLCVVRAFVRGPRKLRIKAPFNVHEMLTSWDDMSVSNMVLGGVPADAEKAELLKALVEHRVV
jgi:hypothetical protein